VSQLHAAAVPGSYFVLRQVRNGKDETEKEKEKKKEKEKGKGKGGKGRRRARSARRDRARSAQWQTSISDLRCWLGWRFELAGALSPQYPR